MRESAFAFLRGNYWRWAETILDVCPDLADAPAVLAVGDTHLENFGTWTDREGRIVWGVNDYDETAEMPYILDLVRLAASAALAATPGQLSLKSICNICMTATSKASTRLKPSCSTTAHVAAQTFRRQRSDASIVLAEDRKPIP